MKSFSAILMGLLALSLVGCGASAKGPAKPEDTPVVSTEEVMTKYKSGMPADQMQHYKNRMPGSK